METRFRAVSANSKGRARAPCIFPSWNNQVVWGAIRQGRLSVYVLVPGWWVESMEIARHIHLHAPRIRLFIQVGAERDWRGRVVIR